MLIKPEISWEDFEKVDIRPGISMNAFQEAGFSFQSNLPSNTPATLVTLSTPNEPNRYWLGLQNYYVITRYNRSAAYAMSVIELGAAIRDAYSQSMSFNANNVSSSE